MQVLEQRAGTTRRQRVAVDGETRFVKRPSPRWRARALTELAGLTEAEVRFYRELAPEVPVRVPTLISAHHGRLGFELVLEDLVRASCRFLAPGDALDADRAQRVLIALAALHARFWEDARFDGSLGWLTDLRRREVVLGNRLARPLMALGLARAGALVPRTLHAPARRYAAQRAENMARLGRGPRTLVHHDCHPGNLFFTPEGEPGLLDWQLVRTGSWASDVAYLLATGLEASERREHGAALLRAYLAALPGRLRPSFERAETLVRAHTAYAFEAMLLTLAVGQLMARRDSRILVERTARAALDTDCFALLSG